MKKIKSFNNFINEGKNLGLEGYGKNFNYWDQTELKVPAFKVIIDGQPIELEFLITDEDGISTKSPVELKVKDADISTLYKMGIYEEGGRRKPTFIPVLNDAKKMMKKPKAERTMEVSPEVQDLDLRDENKKNKISNIYYKKTLKANAKFTAEEFVQLCNYYGPAGLEFKGKKK